MDQSRAIAYILQPSFTPEPLALKEFSWASQFWGKMVAFLIPKGLLWA